VKDSPKSGSSFGCDEEYQEVNCSSVVGNISARNAKYTAVLETERQMVV